MALEGTIKDFGLPDIFQLIGLQRKTGLLTLKNAQEQVTVTFENGAIVMADTSGKRLEDRLGNVLVKQGKLTRERLEEALGTQKQTLQRLGHVLLASGAITPQNLKDAITLQVSQIVFRLFRWKEGDYNFAPADSVDYDRENLNPMSADFVLMEGIRMVDEWPIIEKKIPSMDIVFRSLVDRSSVEVGEGGDGSGLDDVFGGAGEGRPQGGAGKVRLSGEEHRVFRLVDGSNTVQAIIDACGLSEFDTCRVLFDLLNRTIVAPVGKVEARQAAAVQSQTASTLPGHLALGLALLLSAAAVAVHFSSPFGVLGFGSFLEEPRALLLGAVSRERMERLDRAAHAYRLEKGVVPADLRELVTSGLVSDRYLTDPWGRPYEYEPLPGGYVIRAPSTPDGEPGPEVRRSGSQP